METRNGKRGLNDLQAARKLATAFADDFARQQRALKVADKILEQLSEALDVLKPVCPGCGRKLS